MEITPVLLFYITGIYHDKYIQLLRETESLLKNLFPAKAVCMYTCIHGELSQKLYVKQKVYWRIPNNCTASDRLKRFVFQRCRLLLVVNVTKKHSQCKYATLYGYETVAR